jgi:hypothetical protein
MIRILNQGKVFLSLILSISKEYVAIRKECFVYEPVEFFDYVQGICFP